MGDGAEPAVWNGFTQAALDAAYNNSAAVADSAARIADWTQRSAALRTLQPRELEIAYGRGDRQRFDVLRCGQLAAPMLVFIHGGWWQRNSKEVFSCMAVGPMARGFDVALLGYTLAPEASLEMIAGEIWTGLDALAAYRSTGGRASPCIVSGWSAGGHLAALSLNHSSVRAGLAISGVFDLEPVRHSYINDKLKLDAGCVTRLSPVAREPCGKPLALSFGLNELPELQRQSADYGAYCARHGTPALGLPLAGHDHFSILEELASPDGALTNLAICLSRIAGKV
jgi:arylformamidase